MNVWPLRFRDLDEARLFFANDAGGYFVSDRTFLDRYAQDNLSENDLTFLTSGGHTHTRVGDLHHTAFTWHWTTRQSSQERLSYVILVPTLRCNLACNYCQV